MGQLKLDNETLVRCLENALEGAARNFRVIVETEDMWLVAGISDSKLRQEEDLGTPIEIKVCKNTNRYDGYLAYWQIFYRRATGWEDMPFGQWRWLSDLVMPIPMDPMPLDALLMFDGVQLDQQAADAAGLGITGETNVYGGRSWLFGDRGPKDPLNKVQYKDIMDAGAIMDIVHEVNDNESI